MKNKEIQYIEREISTPVKEPSLLAKGERSLKQLFAPGSVSIDENYIRSDENYAKGFVLNGYPPRVSLGWMEHLYSYGGDMDVLEHIIPTNQKKAIDDLTSEITKYEAQYITESNKGSIRNVTSLNAKIQKLVDQRASLEQNLENFFQIEILAALYDKDKNELSKNTEILLSELDSSSESLMSLGLRHDEGIKSVSPLGNVVINDFKRNINTGALSTTCPFVVPDECDPNGTIIGINKYRNSPVSIDFWKRSRGNQNLIVIGASGSGKSYLGSLLILRQTVEGVRHCIVDPENDYRKVTEAVGGIIIGLDTHSENKINPFDIDEEVETNEEGVATGRIFVDLKGKTAEIVDLLFVMLPDQISPRARAILSDLILGLYYKFGFTEDPDSLYEHIKGFDNYSGTYYNQKVFRTMPVLSNLRAEIFEYSQMYNDVELNNLGIALGMFCYGGMYDIFDCYSTVNMADFKSYPIVTFDTHAVDDGFLRPVVMHVVLTWCWNKFIKKDINTKKRIVCDEAWMLLSTNISGSQHTAHFLENCARRVRKYNGSLCCLTQHFNEFLSRQEGQAILANSAVRIFLKQATEDVDAISGKFILSEGEVDYLIKGKQGDVLVKVGNSSVATEIRANDYEHSLITKKHLKDN